MAYQAKHRFARIAPRKARLIADLIRGLDADQAMIQLGLSKKRAAYYYRALLRSCIANAEDQEANPAELMISESRVDEGPVIKRFRPKDRGRAHPIQKKTSHLYIALDAK
jgi:large subunit ribosomal protein L22